MRMIFRGLGNFALILATAAFLVSISLMIGGSFLMTYPLLRKSPRQRRVQATAELAAAGIALLSTFRQKAEDQTKQGKG